MHPGSGEFGLHMIGSYPEDLGSCPHRLPFRSAWEPLLGLFQGAREPYIDSAPLQRRSGVHQLSSHAELLGGPTP
eukprot:9865772-Alexandrium_andersonii.AAC.2